MQNSQKNFLLYDASAGSGKTFTLVRNFLSQLLRDPNSKSFQHILAVTFTNKAANEMKSRIIGKLQELKEGTATTDDYVFFQEVTQLDKANITKRAEQVLNNILHNYSLLSVSTIDKFNLRILRSFSRDFGIAYGFDVDMDPHLFYQRVADRLFADLNDPELIKQMVNLSLEKLGRDEDWDFSDKLSQMVTHLNNDVHIANTNKFSEKSFEEIIQHKNKLQKRFHKLEPQIRQIAQALLQEMENLGLGVSDFAGGANFGFYINATKYANNDILDIKPLSDAVLRVIEGRKFTGSKAKKAVKDIIEANFDHFTHQLLQIDELVRERNLLKPILNSLGLTTLLVPMAETADLMRDEENIILISDVNQLLRKQIGDEDAPYIYERIGTQYTSFFIDEFQDTSDFQWDNILPLLENARAQGHFIMIVGDPKQSIYRFRGGNPELMMGLTQDKYPDIHPIQLETNWRSQQNIVTFNNGLYQLAAEAVEDLQFQQLYRDTSTQKYKDYIGGYVEIEFFENPKKQKENSDQEEESQNYPSQSHADYSEYSDEEEEDDLPPFEDPADNRIIEIIEDCLTRNYQLSDIAILVAFNAAGTRVANLLTISGYNVVSDDSLILSKNANVQLIMKFLYWVANPTKQSLKADFIIQLQELGKIPEDLLTEFLIKVKTFDYSETAHALKTFGINIPLLDLDSLMLYSFVESFIESMGWSNTSDAFLIMLLDEVLTFQMQRGSDLSAFLDFWDMNHQKLKLKSAGSQDAVRIMSMHKSKGLEFPIVIIPDLRFKARKKSELWIETGYPESPLNYVFNPPKAEDIPHHLTTAITVNEMREEIDRINLLYVATTRAENELYILGNNSEKGIVTSLIKNYIGEDKEHYTFGEKTQNQANHVEEDFSKILQIPMINNHWQQKVRIAHEHTAHEEENRMRAREFGDKVHRILEHIVHKDDLDKVLQKFSLQGIINREEQPQLRNLLLQVMEHPLLQDSFSGYESLSEREFIDENGRIFKPDRLVVNHENQWTLIDYKTGSPSETHQNQIQRYAEQLQQMNYNIHKMFLVYLSQNLEIQQINAI
ncbi:MAG: UvrD-helicase domain-containing protein [Weeksellaceae bacterium]|nr:UvrD-helicase domain-containing protein [Weeksellaceae bacterium]